MSDNRKIGQTGEDIAAEYLEKNGYKIIERNKHFSKKCEIDIIAEDKNTTVFVEVKTRRSEVCGSPLEAITRTKYNNIKQGVFNYLSENRVKKYRIDVIAVVLGKDIKIEHLKNV